MNTTFKERSVIFKHIRTQRFHDLFPLGVYSVIARLEPRGEARSTAELYLTTKGQKTPHSNHTVILATKEPAKTFLLNFLKYLFFFNFAEIKLEMKPPGKLKNINTCLQYIQYNFVSDRSQTNIKYYSVKLSSGK